MWFYSFQFQYYRRKYVKIYSRQVSCLEVFGVRVPFSSILNSFSLFLNSPFG